MNCNYCKGAVCDGTKKSIEEWNKCPWHKTYSDVYSNYPFEPRFIKDIRFTLRINALKN